MGSSNDKEFIKKSLEHTQTSTQRRTKKNGGIRDYSVRKKEKRMFVSRQLLPLSTQIVIHIQNTKIKEFRLICIEV